MDRPRKVVKLEVAPRPFHNLNVVGTDSPYGKPIELALLEWTGALPEDAYSGRCQWQGQAAVLLRAPYYSQTVAIPDYVLDRVETLLLAWEDNPYVYSIFEVKTALVLAWEREQAAAPQAATGPHRHAVELTLEWLESNATFLRRMMPEYCADPAHLARWEKITGQKIEREVEAPE